MALKATLRGINMMIGVGWLPHQPSRAGDDVSTSVDNRLLVIIIPSQILGSEYFTLPFRMMLGHARHELFDSISVFEPWETKSGVFFLQDNLIVSFHAILLDPTLDIFVLCSSQMGNAECIIHSTHSNREGHVLITKQCNPSAESRRWGMFPSTAEEVAVLGPLGLGCFQRVPGRKMHPSHR
jgi:hypothetical protein